MTRVIHARYNLLNPFDLRAHIFRVDLEFATYYHERHEKIFSSQKVTFGHFLPSFFLVISTQNFKNNDV